jgi:predicted phosphodiesterase
MAWSDSTTDLRRNAGLVRLADLVAFVNVHGHRWHGRIKGLGVQRDNQVLSWLVLEQEHLNLLVSGHVHEPQSKRELRVASLLKAELSPLKHGGAAVSQ